MIATCVSSSPPSPSSVASPSILPPPFPPRGDIHALTHRYTPIRRRLTAHPSSGDRTQRSRVTSPRITSHILSAIFPPSKTLRGPFESPAPPTYISLAKHKGSIEPPPLFTPLTRLRLSPSTHMAHRPTNRCQRTGNPDMLS